MAKKRLEFVDGKSAKFWEITSKGSNTIVRYGRIGSDGHEVVKKHDSAAAAKVAANKMITSKTKKGYAPVGNAKKNKTAKKKSAGKKTKVRSTTAIPSSKSSKKTAAPNIKAFPIVKTPASGHWKSMTKSLWKKLNTQWDWFCDLSKQHGEKPRRPKIGKPITKAKLRRLQKIIGGSLPQEFEKLITEYSGQVTFGWWLPQDEFELPEELQDRGYGGDTLWNQTDFESLCTEMIEYESSGWLSFRTGLQNRLPFYPVGNGDYLAMCMRNGIKNCPVVYLSHDNDPRVNERQIAPNIIDFLVNWSAVGCGNAELYSLEPYVNKKQKRLNGYGRAGSKFRKQLQEFKPGPQPIASSNQLAEEKFTDEWFYGHWRNQTPSDFPLLEVNDADGLWGQRDVNITEGIALDERRSDSEMIQFFYNKKKKIYWHRRWDSSIPFDDGQTRGPVKFPTH